MTGMAIEYVVISILVWVTKWQHVLLIIRKVIYNIRHVCYCGNVMIMYLSDPDSESPGQ